MVPKLKKDLIDLASESNSGRTLLASDEFFAPKENLLRPGRGDFISNKYTDRGKWMDGNLEGREPLGMIGASCVSGNQA